MNFEHGDMCIGRNDNFICSGHFVGLIKLMDGTEYAVLQPKKDLHQFSLVKPSTLEMYTGVVTYRDRTAEASLRYLPPLSKGGKY
jgi:hypothetical protein